MRIAIYLPNLKIGGAEAVSVNLANQLVQRKYDIDILLANNEVDKKWNIDSRINIYAFNSNRLLNSIIPFANYLKKSRPEYVIVAMWPLTIMALMSRFISLSRVKLIFAEHTTWSIDELTQSRIGRFIVYKSMFLFYRFASKVVCVSRGSMNDLIQSTCLPAAFFKTIYNPVLPSDSDVIPNETYPKWSEGEHIKILAVGNLKPIKSYHILIQAMDILLKKIDAKLLIIGDGPLYADLSRLIEEKGIANHVILAGYISNTEYFYKKANVFVLSSSGEGLPTVLIEALYYGVKIVSTDCNYGPREILDDGTYGMLVPINSPNALCDAIIKSVNSKNSGNRLLQKRAEYFSPDNTVSFYESLFL